MLESGFVSREKSSKNVGVNGKNWHFFHFLTIFRVDYQKSHRNFLPGKSKIRLKKSEMFFYEIGNFS